MRALRVAIAGALAVSATLAVPPNLASAAPAAGVISASASPSSLSLGTWDLGQTGTAQVVTVTATGDTAVVFGAAALTGKGYQSFSITGDTCSGATVAPAATCTVTITPLPVAGGSQLANLELADNAPDTPLTVPLSVTGQVGAAGTYYPLTPTRLLDTRKGIGAPTAPVGPGGVVHLQVDGRGGVPASGVSSVVLNVTVTAPTEQSYLTVFPTGVTRPTASSINFPAGWTGANSVTVAVGGGGTVDIYNNSGTVQIIADVFGYYAADDTVLASAGVGGALQEVTPQRLLDSRIDGGPLDAGYYYPVVVDYGVDVNPHIRALVVNVTAVRSTDTGYLTAWDGQPNDLPPTSTLNFTPGKIVPNMAVVPTSSCVLDPSCAGMPQIGVYNSYGTTNIVVDIFGFYDDSTLKSGLRFHPITPVRITDTRKGLGAPAALGPNSTTQITTPPTVANNDTWALALNVTAVAPTDDTYFTLWPAGYTDFPQPLVSNLNPGPGQVVANAATLPIGLTFGFNIYNHSGTANAVIDVNGTFDVYPYTADNSQIRGAGVSAAAKSAATKSPGLVGTPYAEQRQKG
jgi:hypothetical protein